MVRRETNEETNDLKTRQCMARYVEAYVCCSEEQSKANVGYRKPKLENARQVRGIFFIEPDDEEFKHIMKSARRKLEIPMPAAMPCTTPVNCRGKTCSSIGNTRQKCLYCRCRRIYESTIARGTAKVSRRSQRCKRNKFTESLHITAQVYSDASSIKIPDAKAAVDKEWKGQKGGVQNRRRRTREGPEPTCVQTPSHFWCGTCREEGRINVLPWYRLVCVAKKPPVRRRGGRTGLPARVSGRYVVQG